jgi:DNA helicase-2/ATP-dependent DNA helicase PcrA
MLLLYTRPKRSVFVKMVDAEDWQQEQERLDLVTERLRSKIAELDPEVAGLRDQVADIRKRFWEEVTVNTSTDEDFEETFYSIKQQEAVLSERERSHRLRVQRWKSMTRLLPSPYFGRIDFQEDGLSFSEQIYIGVSSFVDVDGMSFLVYDWRTPIASMYYDYSPGASAYETPGGQITGTMMLKRQYQIQGGQLQNVFDTSLTIGDELLQQVLGKGANTQMKSIVATIQKEQNAIIRNDKSRMVLCRGRPAAERRPRLCNGQRTCCINTAIDSKRTRSFFSRLIRCLTVMYPRSFPSSARRTCSRRPFRNILRIGLDPRCV